MGGFGWVKRAYAVAAATALACAALLGWLAPAASAALPAPAVPTASPAGTLAVQVQWQSVAGLPSSAQVLWWELRWRKAGTSTAAGTRTVGSAARASTVGGLAAATTYGFAIRAWTAAGTTPWSPDAVVTPVSPPPAPASVAAGIGAADGTIDIRWSAAPAQEGAPVDRYEVSALAAGGSVPTVLDRAIAPDRTGYTAALTPGKQYTLTVRAAGPTGRGPAEERGGLLAEDHAARRADRHRRRRADREPRDLRERPGLDLAGPGRSGERRLQRRD